MRNSVLIMHLLITGSSRCLQHTGLVACTTDSTSFSHWTCADEPRGTTQSRGEARESVPFFRRRRIRFKSGRVRRGLFLLHLILLLQELPFIPFVFLFMIWAYTSWTTLRSWAIVQVDLFLFSGRKEVAMMAKKWTTIPKPMDSLTAASPLVMGMSNLATSRKKYLLTWVHVKYLYPEYKTLITDKDIRSWTMDTKMHVFLAACVKNWRSSLQWIKHYSRFSKRQTFVSRSQRMKRQITLSHNPTDCWQFQLQLQLAMEFFHMIDLPIRYY